MLSKTTRVLTLALMLVLAGATLAIVTDQAEAAVGDRFTGTVVFVDAPTGLLWFQEPDGPIVKVAAPTSPLRGLQVGQRIEMALTDTPGMRSTDIQAHQRVATQVQNMDAADNLLRLRSTNGEIIDIQAPTLSLDDLHIGESVEITVRRVDA